MEERPGGPRLKCFPPVPILLLMSVEPDRDVAAGPSQEILAKGVNLVHLREFVRSRFGEEAWEQVVADLKPAARAIFSKRILLSSWSPYAVYVEAMKIVVERFLDGDIRKASEIGAYDLEASLNTIYRALYKMGSPSFILRTSAFLWRSYFNVGRMVVAESGRGFAVARIEEFTPPDEVCCWDILGSVVRGLELSGATSVSPVHRLCPLKGDPFMQYEARWVERA
jgi:hypothetical protein